MELNFSVVIPVFNKRQVIIRTITSVITQTYKNFELLIIDDGSTDGSLELITDFFNDERIKIFTQQNSGASYTRNRGVKESKNNYICFLDADDEWLPNYLNKVNEAINLFPDAGLYNVPAFHRNIVTGEGVSFLLRKYKHQILEVNLFEHPYRICAQTSGITINKKHFEILQNDYLGGGFPINLRFEEDMACFFSLALISASIYIGFQLSIRNNNIEGQLTGYEKSIDSQLLNYQKSYLNILCGNYHILNKQNYRFEKFIKHEIRARISSAFNTKNPTIIKSFINELDYNTYKFLNRLEFIFYKKSSFHNLAIIVTKILRIPFYLRKYSYKYIG
jgi:glycosyltransferase involved in cell wall biosynthesis